MGMGLENPIHVLIEEPFPGRPLARDFPLVAIKDGQHNAEAEPCSLYVVRITTERRPDADSRKLLQNSCPDRLLLEWCSAAEGGRWQTIMTELEKKRQTVTREEVTREAGAFGGK